MKNGLSLIPPLPTSVRAFSSVVGNPPLPLPMTTPILSRSMLDRSNPASSIATPAEATANCENRAIRRTSRVSIYVLGSKPVTSPAILEG